MESSSHSAPARFEEQSVGRGNAARAGGWGEVEIGSVRGMALRFGCEIVTVV